MLAVTSMVELLRNQLFPFANRDTIQSIDVAGMEKFLICIHNQNAFLKKVNIRSCYSWSPPKTGS